MPSYLVLVPMLVLLPPGVVPLLVAAGLMLGAPVARLGTKLATAVEPDGTAYRLGGDEFCVLLEARGEVPDVRVARPPRPSPSAATSSR